jgi:hypothetical protein
VALSAPRALAQAGQATWVSLDGSPAGTPVSVTLDPEQSTPQQSIINLIVHGYWLTPRLGDDGRSYQQISAPGLYTTMEFGAPEMPVMRLALGIVTGATNIGFGGAQVSAQSTHAGMLPYPHIIEALPDTIPRQDRFVRDDAKYSSPYDYPGGYAQTFDGIDPGAGGFHAGIVELHPFRWNASGTLTVDDHVRYTFDHPGTASPVELGSPMTAAAAVSGLANPGVVSPYVTWDTFRHKGYFLFIVPSGYEGYLSPLIEQKKKRGFLVTVIHTDDIRNPYANEPACGPTREAIRNWYLTTPKSADHYCILAANHVFIPTCYAPRPFGYELGPLLATDDYYGDVDGNGVDDEGQEVYVGRIPNNDATEMSTAVAKILAYEDTPPASESYDTAALISWNSASDFRFKKALNVVAAAAYSVPPIFDTIDGGNPAVTNTTVNGAAQGDGILTYDGHGSPTEWWAWNVATYSYSNTVLDGLVNHPNLPILWSFACFTADINVAECFGKHWLTHGEDGGVAFYGATEESWIWDNGVMARRLFDAVFNHAFTVHAIAIAFEEFGTILELGPDNPVQYLLLGDPEMHVRREDVAGPPYVVHVPPFLVAGPVPPIDINVKKPDGRPVAGLKVAIWKKAASAPASAASPSRATSADEVLDNRYTDAQGNAHFDLPPLTSGTLYVTTMDDEATEQRDSVGVNSSTEVGPSSDRGRFAVANSVARGRAWFTLPDVVQLGWRLEVLDVTGRVVRRLALEPGRREIEWDGRSERGIAAAPGLFLARLAGPEGRLAWGPPALRFVLLR